MIDQTTIDTEGHWAVASPNKSRVRLHEPDSEVADPCIG
jgi:hypothetical protein